MSRYYGVIGYGVTSETSPGVWESTISDRLYYGDIKPITRSYTGSDKINEDFKIGNQLSIVADAFALNNFASIKYAVIFGQKWSVTEVEVQPPRLILHLGGLYNA